MDVIRVVPRIIKKDGTPILFMPDYPANDGYISSYMHLGQHAEALLEFYRDSTRPAYPDDAEILRPLLNEYRSLPPHDVPLKVMRRLPPRFTN